MNLQNYLNGYDFNATQISQFEVLESQYREWNARINVISRKDIDHFFIRHLLHSLSIAMVIKFIPGTTVMDAGTGGGFPGVPLAILFPEVQFTLVDSTGKKIYVINEICKSLDIHNITTRNIRFEVIKDRFEFITGRAVSDLPEFFNTLRKNLLPTGKNSLPPGIFYLTGGEIEGMLTKIRGQSTIWNLCDFFPDSYFETKKLVHLIH